MLCKLTVNCGVVSREKRKGKKKCDKKKNLERGSGQDHRQLEARSKVKEQRTFTN